MRAREGDSSAFGELIERHFPGCVKRAFAMLRNHSDAEDEVQNTFSKAFENLSRFRSEGSFSAWLYRILQNQCRMLIRQRRQSRFVYVDATTPSNARVELVDQVVDQEDELGAREVDSLLLEQVSRVPPLMRHVVVLRDIEGLSMAEVAQQLGLSVPAAKSRLMRARREIRARLKKRCGRGPYTLTSKAAHKRVEYTYVS
jgi:RNA polymerase sigma-70 factor (ECF subfamily)